MNYEQTILWVTKELKTIGLDSCALEARILLCHVLDISLEQLLIGRDKIVGKKEHDFLVQLLNRRMKLEPIAYITGYKEFYGQKFCVNKNVLIPRPDTEILVDAVLNLLTKNQIVDPVILDLGTGSGCIILSLLHNMPEAIGMAVDISENALIIARRNAESLKLENRVSFLHSDWFSKIQNKKFDIIVANPPYISIDEFDLMAKETKTYEPKLALFADNYGAEYYITIARDAKKFLTANAKIFLEIGCFQSELVKDIFIKHGYNFYELYKDLTGHVRVLSFSV